MQKILNIVILLLFSCQLFAQQQDTTAVLNPGDSTKVAIGDSTMATPGDSTVVTVDSVKIRKPRSVVDAPIEYECDDSMMVSLTTKNVYMYVSTKVKSGSMTL